MTRGGFIFPVRLGSALDARTKAYHYLWPLSKVIRMSGQKHERARRTQASEVAQLPSTGDMAAPGAGRPHEGLGNSELVERLGRRGAAQEAEPASTKGLPPSMSSMWGRMDLGGGTEEEESELLSNRGGSSRVTGPGANRILEKLGEPRWVVDDRNSHDYFQDRMEVVGSVHYGAESKAKPKAQIVGDDNVIGSWVQVGGMTTLMWMPLTETTPGGVHLVIFTNLDGSVDAFSVKYTQARKRKNNAQRLMGDDGEMTLQWGLYRYMEAATRAINFISPADNVIQMATGRNLNSFDEENFGKELNSTERASEGIQGILDLCGVFTGASKVGQAAKAAWLSSLIVGGSLEALEVVIRAYEDTKGASQSVAHALRSVKTLFDMRDAVKKGWKDGLRSLEGMDYLKTIETLAEAGEEMCRAVLGDHYFTEDWEQSKKQLKQARKDVEAYTEVKKLLAR